MKIPKIFRALGIIIFQFSAMFGAIILCLLLIVWGLFALVSQAPHRITESWQTVTINSLGTFRVPAEWNVEEHERFLYITDRPMIYGDYTIYILGAGGGIGVHSHTLFDEMERDERRTIFGLNNSAVVSVVEYRVNGAIQNHRTISFNNLRGAGNRDSVSYTLFVWDMETVNEWYIEQIARTFSIQREGFDRENAGRLVQ